MTDRKGVPPVEGASIAEACPDCGRPIAREMPQSISAKGPCARQFHPVAADDCIELTVINLRAQLVIVRSALERAAAEGEAWRVIEEWCGRKPTKRTVSDELFFLERRSAWAHRVMLYDWKTVKVIVEDSRLEALQAAAEWVKAQALPAPPKGST